MRAFLLFFLSILFLALVVLYMYYQNEKERAKEQLFLEMKAFSLTLNSDKFGIDIVTPSAQYTTHKLYENETTLFVFFPILEIKDSWLKISQSRAAFEKGLSPLYTRLWVIGFILVAVIALLSALFAWYALFPIQSSYALMERFLKDIIHDLNTPVTAILLNSRLLRKKQSEKRLKRIELAAQTIESLHKNLESFIRDDEEALQRFDLKVLIQERIDYFKGIYTHLDFVLTLESVIIESKLQAWQRILDNIISNACKYNRPKGRVEVILSANRLSIADEGVGIKHPNKVFNRFYKEGERGLGLGLSIVKSLADKLSINIEIKKRNPGTAFVLSW